MRGLDLKVARAGEELIHSLGWATEKALSPQDLDCEQGGGCRE